MKPLPERDVYSANCIVVALSRKVTLRITVKASGRRSENYIIVVFLQWGKRPHATRVLVGDTATVPHSRTSSPVARLCRCGIFAALRAETMRRCLFEDREGEEASNADAGLQESRGIQKRFLANYGVDFRACALYAMSLGIR